MLERIRTWSNNRNARLAMIAVAVALLFGLLLLGSLSAPLVHAQATATPTNTNTPSPTPTLTPTPIATGLANPQGGGFLQYLRCGAYSFGVITPGACLQVYNGSDMEAFSAAGARTFFMDGETGNVTTAGTFTVTGAVNGYKCVHGSQSITGSGTAIPATMTAAGISTPSIILASLNSASTGDLHHVSAVTSGGAVTLQVWNSALTPAASSGAATVAYEICGN